MGRMPYRTLLYNFENVFREGFVAAEKSVSVSFRVSPRFKELLGAAASHEKRSLTNMLEVLLERYCDSERIAVEPSIRKTTTASKNND